MEPFAARPTPASADTRRGSHGFEPILRSRPGPRNFAAAQAVRRSDDEAHGFGVRWTSRRTHLRFRASDAARHRADDAVCPRLPDGHIWEAEHGEQRHDRPLVLIGIRQAAMLLDRAFEPRGGRYGAIKVLAVVRGTYDVTVTVPTDQRDAVSLLYDPEARANEDGFRFSAGDASVTFEACGHITRRSRTGSPPSSRLATVRPWRRWLRAKGVGRSYWAGRPVQRWLHRDPASMCEPRDLPARARRPPGGSHLGPVSCALSAAPPSASPLSASRRPTTSSITTSTFA
jgi:hypothetical protein